jgi:hypothetical protein
MYNEHVVSRHLSNISLLTDIRESYTTGKYTISKDTSLRYFQDIIDTTMTDINGKMAEEMGLWETETSVFA